MSDPRRPTLKRLAGLRRHLRRLTHPVRKLAYHGGAYRNLAAGSGLEPGANLVGFARGELGIGQHLRGVAAAFEAAGIDFAVHDYDRTLHRQQDSRLEHRLDPTAPFAANLFCLNADGVLDLYGRRRELFEGRYNIGYGFWELSDFPEPWLPVMNVLDEIWAPSRHVQDVVCEKTAVPVVRMPLAVEVEAPGRFARADFGLPENAFVFLFTFDFSSRVERKNPLAVVDAFRRAFPAERRDVLLVLKSKTVATVAEQVADRQALGEAVRGDERVRLIDDTWDHGRVLDLIRSADAYVSLHRAEGFGLGLAEAMMLGKPVVATAYSGNLDFTRPDTALLVGCKLIDVAPGRSYYGLEGESVWAEPDVEEAARCLRCLADDREAAAELGVRGRRYVEEHHSPAPVGERCRRRLERIGLLKEHADRLHQ